MSRGAGAHATIEPDENEAGAATAPASSARAPGPARHQAPAWLRLLPWVMLALTGLGAAGMAWQPARHATYDLLTDETGPVELGTFLCFLAAALVAARAARTPGASVARKALLVFALLSGLAAMEEISWGQQLFAFKTPDWFFDWNVQGETNLHNLEYVSDWSSAAVLGVALVGLAAAFRDDRRRGKGFRVPRDLMPLFAVIALLGAIETANDLSWLGARPSRVVGTISELTELWLALACLLVARFQLRHRLP